MIRAYTAIMRVCYAIASTVALALFAVILAGIVSRQFYHPLIWSNEVSITLFLWLIFLGAGVAAAENAHIRVMILPTVLPESMRRVLLMVVTYVGVVILLAVFAESILVTYGFSGNRFTTIPFSSAWDWAALPAGIAIMLLGWVRHGDWTWVQAGRRHDKVSEPVI